MSTATAVLPMTTAVTSAPACGLLMMTWRCVNMACRKVILTFFEYGGDYREHRCECKTWNILPRDSDHLRREVPKYRPGRR
jgi:hypothetical protein